MITVLLLLGAIFFGFAILAAFVPQLNVVPWVPMGLLCWILTALLPRVGAGG